MYSSHYSLLCAHFTTTGQTQVMDNLVGFKTRLDAKPHLTALLFKQLSLKSRISSCGLTEYCTIVAQSLNRMTQVMDNLVGFKTRLDAKPERTAEEAVELIKDVFVTAGERDIYTGDAVEICVISAKGTETTVRALPF